MIGSNATSTTGSILEVAGYSLFRRHHFLPYAHRSIIHATSSPASILPFACSTALSVSGTGYFGSASTSNLTVSGAAGGLLKTSATRCRFRCIRRRDYVASVAGDWTGTFDGLEGSFYLANAFATTSADDWQIDAQLLLDDLRRLLGDPADRTHCRRPHQQFDRRPDRRRRHHRKLRRPLRVERQGVGGFATSSLAIALSTRPAPSARRAAARASRRSAPPEFSLATTQAPAGSSSRPRRSAFSRRTSPKARTSIGRTPALTSASPPRRPFRA